MQIGTLVKMKGDPHGILGVVSEVIDDQAVSNKNYYKVLWADEICDPSYADKQDLEIVCKRTLQVFQDEQDLEAVCK